MKKIAFIALLATCAFAEKTDTLKVEEVSVKADKCYIRHLADPDFSSIPIKTLLHCADQILAENEAIRDSIRTAEVSNK